jgi:hypothetical protein
MVEQLGNFSAEVTRVAREVGTEGKLGGQAKVKGVAGHVEGPDRLGELDGRQPHRAGEEHRRRRPPLWPRATSRRRSRWTSKGEFLTLKSTINTMVDQLRSFASEVTRVAREVGSDGILGGQARGRKACRAPWKDLTESVNFMAGNLTSQVRNIADVTKAGGGRRPLEEDHGGRERRDRRAQEHRQYDGGPTAFVRLRGDARRS